MSQADLNIANQSHSALRSELNAQLQALGTLQSGTSAPGTTYALEYWADTTDNVLKQRNAANTDWVVRSSLDEFPVLTRSSNTALKSSDRCKTIIYTGSHTQTFNAASTLGAGWFVRVVVNSGVTMVFDPSGSEQIDGVGTRSIVGPADGIILCTGTAFKALGMANLAGKVNRVVDFEDLYAEGTTDHIAALGTAATLFNSLGGGTLNFRLRNYAGVFPTGPQVAAAFSALDGFEISGAPSTFTMTQTDALNQSATLFQFTSNCKRCAVRNIKLVAEDMAASSFLSSAGQRLIHLKDQNADFHLHNVAQDYGLALLQVTGTAGATNRTVGISQTGYAHAKGVTYGANFQYNGDGVHFDLLTTEGCYRSYFAYGVVNHWMPILSKNARHDDVIVAGLDGQGCESIHVWNCQIDAPTNAGAAQAMISLQHGPSTLSPVKMRDIHIHLVGRIGAAGGTCGYTYGFRLKKADNAGAADTTDRGHILSDITVSGNYAGAAGVATPNAGFQPFLVCDGGVGGVWGSGEFITNFVLENWSVPFACAASYFTPNAAALCGSVLRNVSIPSGDLQLSVAAPGVLLDAVKLGTRTEGTPAVITYRNCRVAGVDLPDNTRNTALGQVLDLSTSTGELSNTHGTDSPVMRVRATKPAYAGAGILAIECNNASTTVGEYYPISFSIPGSGVYRFLLANNGSLFNTTGVYSTVSDRRKKRNIRDQPPQLADLLRVRTRLFELIDDPGVDKAGVISQELLRVFPELVEAVPDRDADGNLTGTETLNVNYYMFIPKLIKALQELHEQLAPLLWLLAPLHWMVRAGQALRRLRDTAR